MQRLTKYEVLAYLAHGAVRSKQLVRLIRQNAFFAGTGERRITQLIAELKRDGLAGKDQGMITPTDKAADLLAFLLWMKKDGVDHNAALQKTNASLFREVFARRQGQLTAISKLSKPTTLKAAKALDQIRFITVLQRKPLVARANANDKTIFLANAFGYDFTAFQKGMKAGGIKRDSPQLREHLIRLHVYSTTVTEGNTATERDVEKVLSNLDSRLTPKEVIEIVNAKRAIDAVCRVCEKEELTIELIKRLHGILMAGLVENPGQFSYLRKRIIGSSAKLPDSKIEIETGLAAMLNFHRKYARKMRPAVHAALLHFLFVSIHPFLDGNGRVARLIHSFVLMKAGLPLFAFDPNYRNDYFSLLDKGRSEDVAGFVQFCIERHQELINDQSTELGKHG
ncbi:MAG: Fic family protein [Candidatus Aenigmarchaeota archaeon]|nr:Fic family protein [Candidatus Aenigmarchaeota archaeon]